MHAIDTQSKGQTWAIDDSNKDVIVHGLVGHIELVLQVHECEFVGADLEEVIGEEHSRHAVVAFHGNWILASVSYRSCTPIESIYTFCCCCFFLGGEI